MRTRGWIVATIATALLITAARVPAESIMLQDGLMVGNEVYDGTRDTTILGDAGSVASDQIRAKRASGNETFNILLRFETDNVSLPAEHAVAAATMKLFYNPRNAFSGTPQVCVYRAMRPWDEASATWTDDGLGGVWGQAGAQKQTDPNQDRSVAEDSFLKDDFPPRSFSSPYSAGQEFTFDIDSQWVQDWVDNPASNFGMIIVVCNVNNDISFFSREEEIAGQRPLLEIMTQEIPPAAPTDPEAITVESLLNDWGEIHVTWTDVATNETGYEIERSLSSDPNNFQFLATLLPGTSEYFDPNVEPATQYCYRVRAITETAQSDYTDPTVCATTWTQNGCLVDIPADFNHDCIVNILDIATLADQWLLRQWDIGGEQESSDGFINYFDWPEPSTSGFVNFAELWLSDVMPLTVDIAPGSGDDVINVLDLLEIAQHWLEDQTP